MPSQNRIDGPGAGPFRLRSRVPWATKLRPDAQPKLVPDRRGTGIMLVPTPLLAAAEIRRIRRGHVVTVRELRERMARRSGAASACPFTTGIFLQIIAGAAEEDIAAGRRAIAPYWRVLDNEGRLKPGWPPGPERQAQHLRAEGRQVVRDSTTGDWLVKRRQGR